MVFNYKCWISKKFTQEYNLLQKLMNNIQQHFSTEINEQDRDSPIFLFILNHFLILWNYHHSPNLKFNFNLFNISQRVSLNRITKSEWGTFNCISVNFFFALLRRTSFWPPSRLYISVIITHITNYKLFHI